MDKIDFDNIIEEIEALGRSEEHELINRLGVLIGHLLKWQFQNKLAGHGWRCTIKDQRNKIKRIIRKNPSLKPKINEAMCEGHIDGVILASKDTGLDEETFPSECPYSFEQILDDDLFPG